MLTANTIFYARWLKGRPRSRRGFHELCNHVDGNH
jgi:hypothetical protein